MTIPAKRFSLLISVLMLFSVTAFAQTTDRRQPATPSNTQEQPSTLPPNATSLDVVANELGLLRKSLQTLNVRLRELSNKSVATDPKEGDKQSRIAFNLELLTRTEQRAELLRKQLFELIEKETSLRTRLVQIDEDMRPENIERAMNLVGTTRTAELRDARRRVLDSDRKGIESLLSQTTQSRQRLEDDVRQADLLVSKLRQRILPIIENEIEKLGTN